MRLRFPIPRHDSTKYIRLSTTLCKACWMCVQACPNDVIGKVDLPIHKHAHIDQAEKCRGCQKCVRACPNGAILYTGHEQPRKSERSPLERALKKVLPPTLLSVYLVLMVAPRGQILLKSAGLLRSAPARSGHWQFTSRSPKNGWAA